MNTARTQDGWSKGSPGSDSATLTPAIGVVRQRAPIEPLPVDATTPTPLTAAITLGSGRSHDEAPSGAETTVVSDRFMIDAIMARIPDAPPAPSLVPACSAIALFAVSSGAIAIMFPILPGSVDAASGVAIAAFAVATVVDRRVFRSAAPFDVIAAAIGLSFMGLTLSIATGVAGTLFPLSALYVLAGALVVGLSCVGAWNDRRPLLMRVLGGSMFLLGLHVMQGS